METIKATDNLVIELCPGGVLEDDACLVIRTLGVEAGGEPLPTIVYLSEVPALCEALMEAAALLAAGEVYDYGDEYEQIDSDWLNK